jgi:hypothetical protein
MYCNSPKIWAICKLYSLILTYIKQKSDTLQVPFTFSVATERGEVVQSTRGVATYLHRKINLVLLSLNGNFGEANSPTYKWWWHDFTQHSQASPSQCGASTGETSSMFLP